jgi:hypothetical protein
MFATCCIPTSHRLHAENQTKTTERRIRAHGAYAAYAAEPTARSHLPAVPGSSHAGHQAATGQDAAARGVIEGGAG